MSASALSSIHLALLYTLVVAVLDVLLRALQRQQDRSWGIALLGSWAGALVLVFCVDWRMLSLSLKDFSLLILAGVCWALMVWFDFKAQAFADASLNSIINSVRALVMLLVGYLLFNETLGLNAVCGGLLIFLGVRVCLWGTDRRSRAGVGFRLLSVFFGSAAVVVDKYMSSRIDIWLIVFVGYFVPGLLYLMVKPHDWRSQLQVASRQQRGLLTLIIFLYVIVGPLFVFAFAKGALGATFLISQSRLVLVLMLAYFFLQERNNLRQRALGAVLSSIGLWFILEGAR